jgi:hypothetical protein
MAIQALDDNAKAKARAASYDAMKKESLIWDGWSLDAGLNFSEKWSAVEITYDPQTFFVRIMETDKYSLDPTNYRNHVSTTSELLTYIASTFRVTVGFMNMNWVLNDFRLMKLIVRIVDRKPIDFDEIHIDANDVEVWDYFNPEFEEEVLASRPAERGQ